MMNRIQPYFAPGLLFVLLSCCMGCYKSMSPSAGRTTAVQNIQLPLQTILNNNADFSDFDTLLKKSGLYARVTNGDSVFTLLVPDNAAFAASPFSLDSLLGLSADSLQRFVGYHILAGGYPTASIPQTVDNPYTTLSGQTIYFSKPVFANIDVDQASIITGSAILNVNGVTTTKVDLGAAGGSVIQVLSAPLSPPYSSIQAFLSADPDFSYFVTALKQFNLWNELDSAGTYTVFAPVNSAFLNNGITLSMITSDTFNTRHYAPFLFTSCIVSGRVFLTDFVDAEGVINSEVYTPYGSVTFNDLSNIGQYQLPNITANALGSNNQMGGNPGFTLTNQPAANGVVNGITDLIVYPWNVHIAP